jgi:hypothetical protein
MVLNKEEPKYLEKNLSHGHTVHHKSQKKDSHCESTNGLSHGTTSGRVRSINIQKFTSHLAENTVRIHCNYQSVNAEYRNNRKQFSDPHKCTVLEKNAVSCFEAGSTELALRCEDRIPFLLVKGRLVKDETLVLSILMFMECSM